MLESIGKWKVSVIDTGRFWLDGGAMMGSVPKVLWDKTNPSDEYNRIELALRCLLVDNGERVVLIETGLGGKINKKFKRMFNVSQTDNPLEDSLDRNGYSINDITDVILTHLHFDHSGGALKINQDGSFSPLFINATYHISKSNWELGLHPNPRDKASYLSENYIALKESDQLHLVEDNSMILEDISTISVNGHTFGQQLIKISSENDSLVFCSDLIPLRSHLKLPWIMGYDLNAHLTLEEKTVFLLEASRNNWWLYFYHDPNTIAVQIKQGEKHYDIINEIESIE